MIARRTTESHAARRQPILSWEVVGAWLHVWTPPKDVEVPPVPWRWVFLVAAGLVGLVVVAMLTVVPALDTGKEKGRAEQERMAAASKSAQVAHLRRDQRATIVALHRGNIEQQVAAAVGAGARARIRSGELKGGRVVSTECDRPDRVSGGRLYYYCLAVQERTSLARTGLPFVALVSRDRRSLAWCKINPRGGEAVSTIEVPLPRVCRP
jgi:hypothetical protein